MSSTSSSELSPVPSLRAAVDAEPEGLLFYEVSHPDAPSLDVNVVYAGVASYSRGELAKSVLETAAGLFNPPLARWVAGLGYHAILPEAVYTYTTGRPDTYLLPLRNDLAADFARFGLKRFLEGHTHSPKVTGADQGCTLGRIYEKLGERPADIPWQQDQRLSLAVMLGEPIFNALLMAEVHKDRLDEEHCVDGDPTTLSLGKFIDWLNGRPFDSRTIFGTIYTQHYGKLKREFVEAILTWVDSGQSKIFSSFEEAYARYRLPKTEATA